MSTRRSRTAAESWISVDVNCSNPTPARRTRLWHSPLSSVRSVLAYLRRICVQQFATDRLRLRGDGRDLERLKTGITARSQCQRSLTGRSTRYVELVINPPQALIGNVSGTEAATFFANLQGYWINVLWINLLQHDFTGCRSNCAIFDGIAPFAEPGQPLNTQRIYFRRAEEMIGRLDTSKGNGLARGLCRATAMLCWCSRPPPGPSNHWEVSSAHRIFWLRPFCPH